MGYCTLDDLLMRFGEPEIAQLTDMDAVGQPDPDRVDRAIADAQAEIDSYLRGRVPLPLSTVPPEMTRVACDIARYRLYGHGKVPEEVRQRYEDARAWLRDVAAGRVLLQVPAQPAGQGPVVMAPSEVFSDALAGRMPA